MILTPEFRPWVVPFEVTGDRLADLLEGELFQIQFLGLTEIADGLGHGLTLSRGSCFGIVGDEATLRGWNPDGGEMPAISLWEPGSESRWPPSGNGEA